MGNAPVNVPVCVFAVHTYIFLLAYAEERGCRLLGRAVLELELELWIVRN